MAWMPFKKLAPLVSGGRSSGPVADEREFDAPRRVEYHPRAVIDEAPMPRIVASRNPSLDAIGQRNETVRFRIGEMVDRLEDLKSLQNDFSAILEPLIGITEELPRAKIRIAEIEALFAQEQATSSAMRREVSELSGGLAAANNDLNAAKAQLHHLETSLHERDEAVEELRLSLRDKSLSAENLERQLFAESDQSKALLGENKALRLEAQSIDQAFSRAESELAELRENRDLLEQDNRRLQLLSEDQGLKLVDLAARANELEGQTEIMRNSLRGLEQQLATEVAGRQKAEVQYEAEIGAHRTERSSLAMKLEATTSRLGTTEQLLQQVRNQLRERDESGRVAERGLKEALIERVTLERRVESAQSDLARQTEKFLEMQRLRSELDHRCEMLVKAMAAKDAAIEQATGRAASLSDRIEQLVRRQEVERAELEATNHRLIEELQNERSERKLAQGALDIARESRLALQKQHDALKRSSRAFHGDEAARSEANVASDGQADQSAESNVRPFSAADRDG